MNIEEIAKEIVNEHNRKIIKNIFSKLDDEEKYVILVLNNQLQDKINKIDKAIEYIKENYTNEDGTCWHEGFKPILSILGDKENE